MDDQDEPYRGAAQRIYQAINAYPRGWDQYLVPGQKPEWVGRAVSSLILALGTEPITFVSLGADEPSGETSSPLRGVVVGETILAELTAQPDDQDRHDPFVVTARSLNDLVELEVATDTPPYDISGFGGTWPGRVGLVLRFARGSSVRLPVGRPLDPRDNREYVRLVERLPSFLSR